MGKDGTHRKSKTSGQGRRGPRGPVGPAGPGAPPDAIEQLMVQLESIQRSLAIQFERIAQLQADLDMLRRRK
jgi:hypothetical protein